MQLSFWEYKNWFCHVDFTIVGSGIVGVHCALRLRERFPKSKILILEKGFLPEGASTKNAGFACFGSVSEILDDLKKLSEEEAVKLIRKRWNGLQLLRKSLGDKTIDFRMYGGYELFLKEDETLYAECVDKIDYVNSLLQEVFGQKVFQLKKNPFHFENIHDNLIFNPFEGQIDTGDMMQALIKKASQNNIYILNNQTVQGFVDNTNGVEVLLKNFSFKTGKLFFATNGFAGKLVSDEVKPARAQVLITEPIPGLDIKGTFHLDEGYYYFRNIGERILFGGGRNLDFEGESTTEFQVTELIQSRLETLLKEVILPNKQVEIKHRWSGIMGVGKHRTPIIKAISDNVFCGVRLGGMGVAIGSLVGKELADLV